MQNRWRARLQGRHDNTGERRRGADFGLRPRRFSRPRTGEGRVPGITAGEVLNEERTSSAYSGFPLALSLVPSLGRPDNPARVAEELPDRRGKLQLIGF
jgi:hypothetical protein